MGNSHCKQMGWWMLAQHCRALSQALHDTLAPSSLHQGRGAYCLYSVTE